MPRLKEEDILEFEILNWGKYNPPSNNKKKSWFRVDNDSSDRMLQQGFTAAEIGVWLWFLSRRCQTSSPTLMLDARHLCSKFNIRRPTLFFLMDKLERFQCIKRKSSSLLEKKDVPTDGRYGRTDEQKNKDISSVPEGAGAENQTKQVGAPPGFWAKWNGAIKKMEIAP